MASSKDSETFDWRLLLKTEKLESVAVSCVKHVPAANCWTTCVVPGIKLVIRHYDASPSRPSLAAKPCFWVITVMEVQGYFVLVRYLGLGRDASHDFWLHLGKSEIYPVGKELRTATFAPPKFLLGKAPDWRTYFLIHLTGALTIPDNFLQNLYIESSPMKAKYKVGDHIEVIDKYNISQFRVGRVGKITGKRLFIRYVDDDVEDGFFCHEKSSLIHSLGWSTCVGHKIRAPAEFLSTEISPSAGDTTCSGDFQVGMKLEAVDPLCPSRICAASICKVLQFGYIMVKMDCYEEENAKNQTPPHSSVYSEPGYEYSSGGENCWFCYHVGSQYIFKCGFCKKYGIPMVPPVGYDQNKFTWSEYLKKNKGIMAPLPEKPKLKHDFKASMKVEMADLMTPLKIHVATITRVVGRLLRISFDGWEPEYDQWIDAESPDIYPIVFGSLHNISGWCELVGHALEIPKSTPNETQPNAK